MLKEKLRDDGYVNEEIDKIIIDDNKNYKEQVERTLNRLLLFGEAQDGVSKLYVLPWCIDKWR